MKIEEEIERQAIASKKKNGHSEKRKKGDIEKKRRKGR